MTEPLKNRFGVEVIDRIAAMVSPQAPQLDWDEFKRRARTGYLELELMDRARQIARSLSLTLPTSFPVAADLLIRSFGPAHEVEQHGGLDGFVYLPFGLFIASQGLDSFDHGMRANYELTKRFTAEFSVRPYIERDPARALDYLRQWAVDPNVHVRRLVSEGTRPRLPWAGRLRVFDEQPQVMLALLERLRDDREEYVRRSVANHLNDMGKTHPQLLVDVARQWLIDATEARRRLLRHALRSLVKQGNEQAIALLGFDARHAHSIDVGRVQVLPRRAVIGGSIALRFELRNAATSPCALLVDLRVHYVKADGSSSPKVFKLAAVTLEAGAVAELRHTLSLRQMTTRTHYPGRHRLELLVNGRELPLADFFLKRVPSLNPAARDGQ